MPVKNWPVKFGQLFCANQVGPRESPNLTGHLVFIVHSLSSGKVGMFLCAVCHDFTPHVNAWKR